MVMLWEEELNKNLCLDFHQIMEKAEVDNRVRHYWEKVASSMVLNYQICQTHLAFPMMGYPFL